MNAPRTVSLNAWHAAWNTEIKHALVPRTVCGRKPALYCTQQGQVAALEDARWHRLLPLSMSRLVGDSLVCGCHGLVFNPCMSCPICAGTAIPRGSVTAAQCTPGATSWTWRVYLRRGSARCRTRPDHVFYNPISMLAPCGRRLIERMAAAQTAVAMRKAN